MIEKPDQAFELFEDAGDHETSRLIGMFLPIAFAVVAALIKLTCAWWCG